MKSLFILVIIVSQLVILSCEKSEPLAPMQEAGLTKSLEKATATAVSGTINVTPVGAPGEMGTTPGGTTHIRDWTIALTFTDGDLAGTGSFVQNSDWNSVYNGHVSGTLTADVAWQGRSGTFTGQFSGNVHEFYLSATFVCQGSGGFEGMKWHTTIEGSINGPYTYSGHIIDPNGE